MSVALVQLVESQTTSAGSWVRFPHAMQNWVGSSVGLERMPDTHEVEGSSPSLPTKHKRSMIVSHCVKGTTTSGGCGNNRDIGSVAQLVEHGTENPGVGGSNPPRPTLKIDSGSIHQKRSIQGITLDLRITRVRLIRNPDLYIKFWGCA